MAGGLTVAKLMAVLGLDVSGFQDGMGKAKKDMGNFGKEASSVYKNLAILSAGALAVGVALSKAFDIASQAAGLEYAEKKFDNLSKSIGTTSKALMTDLREATKGMYSDSKLVESAGNFMALGLAKSHDEVVRLSTVAGALDMNMNQLVLTLTNKTTMRFDALGVSVDGFKERVAELEKTGLSADEAFNEAFLQQAEAQIVKVGSASDYTIGEVNRMEASMENVGDTAKKALLPLANSILPTLTDGLNNMNRTQQFKTMSSAIKELGLDISSTTKPYEKLFGAFTEADPKLINQMSLISEWANVTYDGFIKSGMGADEAKAKVADMYNTYGNAIVTTQATEDWASANDRAAGSLSAVAQAAAEADEAALEAALAWATYADAVNKVTSLDAQFDSVVKLAIKYDEILTEITEQETIMANNPIGSEKWTEAKTRIEELKQSMTDLANQMTLDMLQATIAIDGITNAEAAAYFKMAADMGLISEEAALAAIEAYGGAIETINGFAIADKEGKVSADALAAYATFDLLEQYALLDKTMRVFVRTYTDTGDMSGQDPYENWGGRATGGKVFGNTPYLVGERGPELFVPDTTGRIVANNQVGAMGDSITNYYTLNMPTTANAADVRTAFELMEAWA